MESRQTNYVMKILFAFGITFIVSSHVLGGNTSGGLSFGFNIFPPANFHVAIFVFVAGYFYKSVHEEHPGAFMKKKVLRLLVPLYLINAIYGIWVLISRNFGFTMGATPDFYSLLIDPMFGGHAFMWDCPLWFIAPLFFTETFDFAMRKLLHVGESHAKELVLIVLYALIGLVTTSLCGAEGFPEGSSSALILLARIGFFLPCYAMGRLYKVFLEAHDTAPNWAYFGVVIAIQLAVTVICEGRFTYLVSWCQFYTGRFIPYITVMTGIAFWLRISRILEPGLRSSKGMLAVADNTYSIMAHQFVGIFLVKGVFALLALCKVISDFDFHQFLGNFWYYYYPPAVGHGGPPFILGLSVVYVVAGIVVPIGIHRVWSKIYGVIKRRYAVCCPVWSAK